MTLLSCENVAFEPSDDRYVIPLAQGLGGEAMPIWQRLLLTLVAMVAASFIVGLIWENLFAFPLPSYVAGLVGGLTALPVWEFLKRVGPRTSRAGDARDHPQL